MGWGARLKEAGHVFCGTRVPRIGNVKGVIGITAWLFSGGGGGGGGGVEVETGL